MEILHKIEKSRAKVPLEDGGVLSVQHAIQMAAYRKGDHVSIPDICRAIKKNKGLVLEKYLQYTGEFNPKHLVINKDWARYRISSCKEIPLSNLAKITKEIAKGPLIGSFVIRKGFFEYQAGDEILKSRDKNGKLLPEMCENGVPMRHAVILYKVTERPDLTYFDFLNSWGELFGSKGTGEMELGYLDAIYKITL